MKKNIVGFIVGTALNLYVTYAIRHVLSVSVLPACFLALSYLCGVLFLFSPKAKLWRTVTYTLNVLILLFGIAYAIYFRRPLGFYTAFSSVALFAKNFIAGPDRKDRPVTKTINAILLLITAAILAVTVAVFSSAIRDPLANGAGVLWSSEDENLFNEIAIGETDEKKVLSTYTWMTENLTYDHNYDCLYQYSNTSKTLQTKTGVCYDIACLFAAICRSQGIPCYVIDGYARTDRTAQHTWNRVLIDGIWYDVDITNDLTAENPYGFHPTTDYNSADENFVIMRIY